MIKKSWSDDEEQFRLVSVDKASDTGNRGTSKERKLFSTAERVSMFKVRSGNQPVSTRSLEPRKNATLADK